MTVENVGSRFHFDLSARFSRSIERSFASNFSSNQVQQNTNQTDFRTRENAFSILDKALSDNLSKKLDSEINQRDLSPARAIAKNVLSFVRQELREARSNGASEEQLQGLLGQAREGIEKGFADARDVLQSRLDSDSRLERQIERAFNRIQRGLERIDNRFTPNVESSPVSQNSQLQEQAAATNIRSQDLNQTQLVEYTKTRDVQRSRSFELSIQTKEGDTVSFNVERFFNKQVKKEASFDGNALVVNIDKAIERGASVSYQVNGDINEQEQGAIDALIKKVDRIADKFYDGNLAGAFKKASRVGIDSEQLANFSLNLQSSKTVEVSKVYQQVQGVPVSGQLTSPLGSIGSFINDVADTANDDRIKNTIADPVPVTTELFKQIASRDERFAQLVLEQSVEVIDSIADLAEQQLAA